MVPRQRGTRPLFSAAELVPFFEDRTLDPKVATVGIESKTRVPGARAAVDAAVGGGLWCGHRSRSLGFARSPKHGYNNDGVGRACGLCCFLWMVMMVLPLRISLIPFHPFLISGCFEVLLGGE